MVGGTRIEALFPKALGDSRIAHLFIYSTNSNPLFDLTLYWTLLGP